MGYSMTVKNDRMTVVQVAVDAGPAAGKLEVYSAGYAALLFSVTLNDPCGVVALGILTFSGMPLSGFGEAAAGAGTDAAIAKLVDSTGAMVREDMTVGERDKPNPGDRYQVEIDNKNIAAGEIVNVISMVFAHAA